MKAITLSRINTALLVGGGGMLLGHVVLPYSPGRGTGVRLSFYAAVALLGALRGLRDATVQRTAPRARTWRGAAFGAAALTLAWIAYLAVHG